MPTLLKVCEAFSVLSQKQRPSVVHYEEERINGNFKFKFFATLEAMTLCLELN